MVDTPEKLCAKAAKKSSGGFLSFLNPPDYGEAARLFEQAANQYKLQQKWVEAGECVIKAGEMLAKEGDLNGQANMFVEASNCEKKSTKKDTGKQVDLLKKAIELYNIGGRFQRSAGLTKQIAEAHEQARDYEAAAHFYKQAAQYYDMEDTSKSLVSQCSVKFADISSLHLGKTDESIAIYEREGEKALANNLLSFGAREHFFKAGILLLAVGDVFRAKQKCDEYTAKDPKFDSREGKFLKRICEASENNDLEDFNIAVQEFNSISPMDQWKIHFIYEARSRISGGASGDATGSSVAAPIKETAEGLPDLS